MATKGDLPPLFGLKPLILGLLLLLQRGILSIFVLFGRLILAIVAALQHLFLLTFFANIAFLLRLAFKEAGILLMFVNQFMESFYVYSFWD